MKPEHDLTKTPDRDGPHDFDFQIKQIVPWTLRLGALGPPSRP